MKISAIIPAAGSGSRFDKNKNKLLENIDDKPVIVHTLEVISSVERIDEIIICTSSDLIEEINNLVSKYKITKVKKIILGGKVRQESVFNGLKAIGNADIVLIHDGARPLISKDIIENSISMAIEKGAAIVAVPAKDTIKRVNIETRQIIGTPERKELWNIQTPQVFKFSEIFEAHRKYQGMDFTDDSALLEKSCIPVFVVNGSYKNIKITTKEDIEVAKVFINKAN